MEKKSFDLKNIIKSKYEEIARKLRLEWEYERKTFILVVIFVLLIAISFFTALRTILLLFNLNFYGMYILNAPAVIMNIIFCIFSFFVWIYSTTEEFFYYHNKKKFLFFYCIANVCIVVVEYVLTLFYSFLVPAVFSITPGEAITVTMLVNFCRILGFVVSAITVYLLCVTFVKPFVNDEFIRNMIRFKLSNVIDLRDNHENLYDMDGIINDSKTGKSIPFFYEDRFMHQFVQGASGVGKTSTVLLKMIWKDFKKKYVNQKNRHSQYMKMIDAGEAILVPDENGVVNPENIKALPGFEKKLEDIRKKYFNCGYTCIGPDTDLSAKVIDFCERFGFDYYVLDPEIDENKYRGHHKGYNPYHISKGLEGKEYVVEVAAKAKMIADGLQSVFEASGKTDPYFQNINTSCATNVSKILMVGMPYRDGREPKLTDLDAMLAKFDRLKPYVEAVKERYRNESKNPFQSVIDKVEIEMLNDPKMSEKLWDQARGLRNILDILLSLPNISDAMCSDDPIDFKEVLEEGKIVVMNFGLKYGEEVAKGFGLMYVMNFHNDVKKRDLNSFLIPHFEVIDEFSLLVHTTFAQVVTLLRKYKIAATWAFQSNAQFEVNETAKYMAKVIQTVGQMIIFGRLDATSAKIFAELGGKERVVTVQTNVSQTSMLSDDPSYQEGYRTMETMESKLDISDLRNTEFLECHIFPLYNGSVLSPVLGKTYFLTEKEKNDIDIVEYDWQQYVADTGDVLFNQPVSEARLRSLSVDEGGFSYSESGISEERDFLSNEKSVVNNDVDDDFLANRFI